MLKNPIFDQKERILVRRIALKEDVFIFANENLNKKIDKTLPCYCINFLYLEYLF